MRDGPVRPCSLVEQAPFQIYLCISDTMHTRKVPRLSGIHPGTLVFVLGKPAPATVLKTLFGHSLCAPQTYLPVPPDPVLFILEIPHFPMFLVPE